VSHFKVTDDFDSLKPPNGLALSCAALIDRESTWADSNSQNSGDLGAACGVSSSARLCEKSKRWGYSSMRLQFF